MWYKAAADVLVVIHLLFIGFVVGGVFLAWRWPRIVWAHIPAVIYGALVEFAGFTCPLTLLENDLRRRAGQAGYHGGFIAHYLVRVIYPPGLTRGLQVGLGVLVLLIMVGGYWGAALHRRTTSARADSAARPARERATGQPAGDRPEPTRPSG
jgi:Protein of Unknown function (DUF2784)